MTNAEIIATIRAEIKRLKNTDGVCQNNNETADIYYARGARFACEALLSFLSGIEKSFPAKIVNGELENEITKVVAEYKEKVFGTKVMKTSGVEKIARHFYDIGCRRTAEKYDEIEYNRQRASGSSEIPKGLEEAALFNNGVEEGKRLMMEDAVKWLVDDDYHEASEKGRFILGSVGLGYNGYYIPYLDLLKLPKED